MLEWLVVQLTEWALQTWFWAVALVLGDGDRDRAGALVLEHCVRRRELRGGFAGDTTLWDMPESVVVKRMGGGPWRKRWGCFYSGQWREARWFEEGRWHSTLAAEDLPNVVFARYSPWRGEMTLGLTWVKESERLGPYLGNQDNAMMPPVDVSTLRFADVPVVDLLKSLFARQAEFHACFFNKREELAAQEWFKAAPWYRGRQRHVWERSVQAMARSWAAGKKLRGHVIPEELVRTVDHVLANSSWDAFQAHVNDPKTGVTLTHGDFHAGNILVVPKSQDPRQPHFVLLDFSEVGLGEGTTDLAQMMISDLHPTMVRAHLREWVRCYHAAFVQAMGGRDASPEWYTEDRVWRDVLRGGVEKWSLLLGLIAGMPVFPDAGVAYFARNLLAWVKFAEEVLPESERAGFSVKSVVVVR